MFSNGVASEEMVAETVLPECDIGSRIECNGHFGTVKYIGPVNGHPSIWLGIDWDDIERGKHNGTVEGVHYFRSKFPKSGSFVRREKVNFGQSLIESIRTRYGYREDQLTAKMNEQNLMKFQQSINAPFIQLVGFDKITIKQSDFHSLEIINVRLQNVSSIGEAFELNSLCPNIREIDISKNLLSSWKDIFDICSQLQHLYWINVSENFLSLPDDYKKYYFPNISVLICGYMSLDWEDIKNISTVFPHIEELRAPYNNISDLSTPSNHNFERLQYLDLEGNDIQQWSEVNKLSVIKMLRHLILENCKLEKIYFNSTHNSIVQFENLSNLNINDNMISEWQSIAELNKLQNLESLRLIRNPVLETENLATRKQIVIAKIKNLNIFNGTIIQQDERRGAEYDYLKKYALQWMKVKETSERNNFLLEHNRYLELIETYGMPEESELVVVPNIIGSKLLTINVEFENRVISKKIPPSISIQKLIMMVQKLFKLEDRPTLRYVSNMGSDIEIDLDDEMKEIGYYSIKNGDTIVVSI